jgi:5'(3')-deoxyribonucleotidase
MSGLIFKVDVDGVLRDIVFSMVNIYNREFYQHMKVKDVIYYDVEKSFPLIKEKLGMSAKHFFFVKHCEDVFLHSNTFPNVADYINEIGKKNRIIICTWQFTDAAKKFTLDWLLDSNIHYDDICFTEQKYLIKSDVIIDDNPTYLKYDESPVKILVDAPYNQDFNEKTNAVRIFRINNFENIENIISNGK